MPLGRRQFLRDFINEFNQIVACHLLVAGIIEGQSIYPEEFSTFYFHLSPMPADKIRHPAYVIGITGKMKLPGYQLGPPYDPPNDPPEDVPEVRKAIRAFLEWLVEKKGGLELVEEQKDGPRSWSFNKNKRLPSNDEWRSLGLGSTPILALSSLAPGTDTIFAEEVLRFQKTERPNIHLRAVLPFPLDLYRESTSFVQGKNKDEDQQRLARFDQLIERIQAQPGFNEDTDIFEVELHPSIAGNPQADLTEIDPISNKALRHRRYRAAGEYISAFSDLLVAIVDLDRETVNPDDPFEAGAEAVVESHLRGNLRGLLAIPPAISSRENGPVLLMGLRAAEPFFAPLEWRHPYGLCLSFDDRIPTAEMIRGLSDKDKQLWHQIGTDLNRSVVRNLLSLHQDLLEIFKKDKDATPTADQRTHLQTLRPKESDAITERFGECSDLAGTAPNLTQLGAARRRLADVANSHDAVAKKLISRMVTFSAVGAGLLIAAWLPSGSSWWASWSYTIPTALAFVIWLSTYLLVYRPFAESRIEDRELDARSTAEAVRVQIAWRQAGMDLSAASSYLHRLRGELSWIRSAVSSMSFPYQPDSQWFAKLKPEEQLRLLRCVRQNWVGEQLNYFRDTLTNFRWRKDSLTTMASTLGWAVLGLFFISLFVQMTRALPEVFGVPTLASNSLLSEWIAAVLPGPLTLLLIGVSPFLVLVILHAVRDRLNPWTDLSAKKKSKKYTRGHIWRYFFPALFVQHGRKHRPPVKLPLWQRFFSPIPGILLVSVLIAVPVLLAAWLDTATAWHAAVGSVLPSLLLSTKSIYATWAAFIYFWVRRKFLSDNIRRYHAIEPVFAGAANRLDELLPEGATALTPEQLAEARGILERLGHEALAENADWLVMHRSQKIQHYDFGG